MKKQLTTILATALLLTSLTGCSDQNTSSENNSLPNASNSTDNSSSVSSEPESSQESSTSTTENSSMPSDSNTSSQSTVEKGRYKDVFIGDGRAVAVTDENRWVLDDFMAEAQKNGVTNPDGSEIIPSDIVTMSGGDNNIYRVTFDYAFITYEHQYYFTEKPELNSADKTKEYQSAITPSEMFKVKAGDVLDNGLKVKSAEYSQNSLPDTAKDEYKCDYQVIRLEGEITLNGYLEYIRANFPEEGIGRVYLWVDDNNCKFPGVTPLPSCKYDEEKGVGMVSNSERIYLRDFPMDKLPSELKEKGMIKVKATIKDPRIGSLVYGPINFSAELVSYELTEG